MDKENQNEPSTVDEILQKIEEESKQWGIHLPRRIKTL